MGEATRFALGIAILVGAMVAFFFAFHPNGVEGVSNPVDVLKWLMNEINTSGTTSSVTAANNATTPNNVGSAPTPTGA